MSPALITTLVCAVIVTGVAVLLLQAPVRNALVALSLPACFQVRRYPYDSPHLGYPLHSPTKADEILRGRFANPPFDENGVPVVDYRWQRWHDMPRGRYYNATTVAQYALWGCFIPWLDTHDPDLRDAFLHQCSWLRDAQDADGCYRNRFAHHTYGQEAGWISAMYQGQAISALVRAHLIDPSGGFLDAARRAATPLITPIDEGGALSIDATGVWLEEVPEVEPSHILNGMIFAWYGLWDLVAVTGDAQCRDILDDVTATMRREIDRYTSPTGVRYELKRTHVVDRGDYLDLQIAQMRSLADMTGHAEFSRTADVWETHRRPPRTLSGTGRLARALVMASVFRYRQIRHGGARRARVIFTGFDPRWPEFLASGLAQRFPERLSCEALIPGAGPFAQLLSMLRMLSSDVVVRVGAPLDFDSRLNRFFLRLHTLRSSVWPVVFWIGSDVARLTKLVSEGALNAEQRALLEGADHIAGAEHLTEELAFADIKALSTPFPAPMSALPAVPAPLPPEFTVLSYTPASRFDQYGGPTIVEAARSMPDVRFLLAGEGTNLLPELPCNVTGLGWVDDQASLYARATVVVRLVEHDAIGGTVMEGLIHGRSVIYSLQCPHTLHVTFGSADELCIALRGLMDAWEDGMLDVDHAARAWALHEFDPDRRFARLADVLTSIARRNA